jgi:hypothetical protein
MSTGDTLKQRTYRVPAERPGALFAWGYRVAVTSAQSKIDNLAPRPGDDAEARAALMVVDAWAAAYHEAAQSRVRSNARPHMDNLIDDLDLADAIPGMISYDPRAVIELGAISAASGVRAAIATASVMAGDSHPLVLALGLLQSLREESESRWAVEWSKVLRDYPWIRRSGVRWPHVSLTPLDELPVFFIVDGARSQK